MSETTADSFRMARFVAALAVSRTELQDFLAAPAELMEESGLTGQEQDLLTGGSFQAVLDYLWEVGEKPAPDDPTGGG